MPKDSDFPKNPYQILDPSERWAPAQDTLFGEAYINLLPPLVHKIRLAVKDWRRKGYPDASEISKTLLEYWFQSEHPHFRYYFAQREAVESVIYLYEVTQAKDKYELLKFDSSGRVSTGMFDEDWPRYVIKMATGTGKTKVASLLLAWSYFHKIYEPKSTLSTNFLITTPNIIVLDRLKRDFADLAIFKEDPVVPEDGFRDKNWQSDFQLTVHLQDDLRALSPRGNIYLTNRHRIGSDEENAASFEDKNVAEYFLGSKPPSDADTGRYLDLGELLRGDKIKDMVVLNDEAHGVRQETKWFENIQDINNQMKLKYGSGLSLELDFSATPKNPDGSIFVQTICDYPLVEAIKQNIVKMPVLPDPASRSKLEEKTTDDYVERYGDYIQLGYEEWKKQYEELKNSGKTPKLFIMTTTTEQANEVGKYLENSYPEFEKSVLVIHTKGTGEISETKTNEKELQALRQAADSIDRPDSPYKALVSVMMLREGWDVKTVGTVVGLRPYTAKAKILPEQTIGRGIRKMFGFDVDEELAIIGTEAFIEFVELIKQEGVEFGYRKMGKNEPSYTPVIVEPDRENIHKDLEKLDIELPRLNPRIYKEYKRLEEIQLDTLQFEPQEIKQFSKEEQREIVFADIDGRESHRIILDLAHPDYRSVIRFFVTGILSETRLYGGFEELYPKVKDFIEEKLFGQEVGLNDLNVIRNLSRLEVKNTIINTFRNAINELTVTDKGGAEIKNYIKLRDARPQVFTRQEYVTPQKSVFNKVVGDSCFELVFASFLDGCSDIISFAKNTYNVHFKMEYVGEDGNIHDYYPDFLVKKDSKNVYVVETKGLADLDVARKTDRLVVWCQDANRTQEQHHFIPLYVAQEDWVKNKDNIKDFQNVIDLFRIEKEYAKR
jgi:type III restriction enzyme